MPQITKGEAQRLVKRQAAAPSSGFIVPVCQRDGLRLVIEFPFTPGLLKNHSHTLKRHLSAQARVAREGLIERIQTARIPGQRRRWPSRKTWLTIQAWKPGHTSDVINLLDGIADAAKEALGLDDRWFSVRGIDWSIDRAEPRVLLTIEADSWEDQLICKICGGIEEERLMKSKRVCAGCQRRPNGGVPLL